MTKVLAIGIDLGTSLSCVSHYKDGRPELIPNGEGDRLTPSVVYFDPADGKVYVGRMANELSPRCPGNCLLDAKRYIGRKFDDDFISRYTNKKREHYSLVSTSDGQVGFEIEIRGRKVIKKPEEVSAEVLKFLRDAASSYLEENVTKVVISVPAYFSNAQRSATKRAAELAGLDVLRLVTEPTAASIFYVSDKQKHSNSNILTFDFGGGTLDVSVLNVNDNVFEVKAVYGDSLLGGRDIDNVLYQYFYMKIFNNKKKVNITNLHKRRLFNMCIELKKNLSIKESFTTYLDRYFGSTDIEIAMSQTEFEEMTDDIFKQSMDVVYLCLENSTLSKSDIDEVILVGGSTRIPKIKKMLSACFDPVKIKTDLNPDEAVAAGASIYAAFALGGYNLEKYKVTEVTPLSLGIGLARDLMLPLIPRNSPIPITASATTVTSVNDQSGSVFGIYEGERKNVNYNNKLGELTITDRPKGRAGDVSTSVNFHLDEDGILSVTVMDTSTHNSKELKIVVQEFRLSDKKIKYHLQDAKKYKIEDDVFEKFVVLKGRFVTRCNHLIYDIKKINPQEDQNFVKERCEKFLRDADTILDYTEIEKLDTMFAVFKNSVTDILQRNLMLELEYWKE